MELFSDSIKSHFLCSLIHIVKSGLRLGLTRSAGFPIPLHRLGCQAKHMWIYAKYCQFLTHLLSWVKYDNIYYRQEKFASKNIFSLLFISLF